MCSWRASIMILALKKLQLQGALSPDSTKGLCPLDPRGSLAPPLKIYPGAAQGRRNEFRSGMASTGSGGDPQRGSKGQSPWWGSGGKAPWKPALLKKLNHNLYSKLIWDYYKMGCVILTRSCSTYQFAFLHLFLFFFSFRFFSFIFFYAKSGAAKATLAVAVPTPLTPPLSPPLSVDV